jgi:hypothetical protein
MEYTAQAIELVRVIIDILCRMKYTARLPEVLKVSF